MLALVELSALMFC